VSVFVDTSAVLALLNADDAMHARVAAAWRTLVRAEEELVTSSYVLIESLALAQARLGPAAARALANEFVPALEVVWVDEALHRAALSAWLISGRRELSLVDCVSFEVMRRRSVPRVLTLDRHFGRQGFAAVP
jgi:predicted nucleic acid-binding protein